MFILYRGISSKLLTVLISIKFVMKHLFLSLLLLASLFSYSQTDAERKEITSNYNQAKLEELKQQYSAKFQANYDKAVKLAKINNWPLKTVDKNGNLNMLVGVHDSGEPIYLSEENLGAGVTSRANTLYPGGSLGLNLTGSGMTASIWDGGSVLTTHQLFGGRVTNVDGAASGDHGTHCGGTIIGSDAFQSGNAKGMAYQANLRSYDWTNDEAEMATEAATGTLISSHSYGIPAYPSTGNPSTPTYYLGKYDANARDMDNIVYNAPYFLPSCSAGNDRTKGINATGYDILTDKSCNKNALTVAAVNEVSNYTGPGSVVMSSFSSWGPTDDGRIKPDISAKGVGTYSAGDASNSDYGYKSGTSMATPSVAGTLVLLQQHYNNVNSSFMLASTLRGLTLHTADEAGTADGPDYEFGWGLINAKKATEAINNNGTSSIINELTLSSGQTYTINVTASGLEDLMATIAWTDVQGTVGPNTVDDRTPVLVNDLDIRITQAASTYMPWKLDPDNPSNAATKADNIVDNIEKVEVTSPSGLYTITVTHKGALSSGSQTYSLIVTGVTVTPTANDAGLNTILHPTNGGTFCDNPLIPEVIIQNYGQSNLTSANIKYQIDNGPLSTYAWSGNLAAGAKDTILLPFITTPIGPAFTFKAFTTDPNSTTDDDNTNDTLTATTQYLVAGAIPYLEPFNTGIPTDVTVFDQTNDGFEWVYSSTVDGYGVGGSGSMVMDNFTNDTRNTLDWMLIPSLDLSSSTNTKLTFDVAYARYNATYMDSLIVAVNDDCGTSYSIAYKKGNSDLATAPDVTTIFTPTAAQWRTDTVDLSGYDGMSHVKLAFINQGGWGQTMYIDNINITQSCTAGTSTDVQTVCNSLTWLDGVTYTANNTSATHTITGGAANGCDSIITLNLTVNNSATSTDVISSCTPVTWIDGNTYSANNTSATHNIVNGAANGCDSLVTLNLTILNPANGTDTRSECGSLTWIDGNTYSANNTSATHNIVNGAANGCDSLVTLNLTILNSANGTDTRSECGSLTWIDGNTYSANNSSATHNIVNGAANGCDSLVTLNLTILNSTTGTDTRSECGSLTWIDGNTYSANNTSATHNIVNGAANGCDSLVTLNLTILNSTTGTDTRSECGSLTWIDGNTYSANNSSATHNIVNGAANGCDSLVTLNLTINTVDISTTNVTNTITANATPATYRWLDCNSNYAVIAGEVSQQYVSTTPGDYAVEVTQNNCIDTSLCVTIATVGIDGNSINNQVYIYPNPNKGIVNVELGTLTNTTIKVVNVTGQTVYLKEGVNSNKYQFELNEAKGVYFIEVISGDKRQKFKLIKK